MRDTRPHNRPGSTHCKHSLQSRATALLLAVSLLLGLLLGHGLGRNNAQTASVSPLTQVILQDLCLSHFNTDANDTSIQRALQQLSDSDKPAENQQAQPHSHCAVCLIALDITLPHHGGTWRAVAEPLSRRHAHFAQRINRVNSPLKPPSHAPPPVA